MAGPEYGGPGVWRARSMAGPEYGGPGVWRSDPAVAAYLVPHVAQPVAVGDDSARQYRVEVPEHQQHAQHVGAGQPGADRTAQHARRGGPEDQPQAEHDGQDQEQLELQRVVVQLANGNQREKVA